MGNRGHIAFKGREARAREESAGGGGEGRRRGGNLTFTYLPAVVDADKVSVLQQVIASLRQQLPLLHVHRLSTCKETVSREIFGYFLNKSTVGASN
jgi:hypothetical protein